MNLRVILKKPFAMRATLLLTLIVTLVFASSRLQADTGTCGGGTTTLPFTDVQGNFFFCSIASAFFSGLTNGTTATTYSPSQNVPREQMAAFVSRTLEQSIRRNNIRAVAEKWYLPPDETGITVRTVGDQPTAVEFDGTDIWVASLTSDTIQRLRTSDGQLLQTFTGANNAFQLVCARGRIFATGTANPGQLYFIDPSAGAGPVSILLNNLPAFPNGIAFDGARVWTANGSGSVSIITINPPQATNVDLEMGPSTLVGIVFDGANMWVTNQVGNKLHKLDASGNILQSIPVGNSPRRPVFDGINIWVPNAQSNSVTVVRVKDTQGNPLATPFVLATLTGNGLNGPETIAFDGERMLVTNFNGHSVSIFKAADLTPLGSISTGASTNPTGACSDGMNFWVTLRNTDRLARF